MLKLLLKKHPENEVEIAGSTIRRAGQEKGLQSHLRFAQVYDLISDGIRIIDNDYNMLYLNRSFRVLAAADADVSFGFKCYDVFPCRKCHTDACTLQRLQKGETEIQCNLLLKNAGGRTQTGRVTHRPLWGPKRRLVGIITVFKDTTEIEEARQALGSVQQLLESETQTLESKRIALKEILNQIDDEKVQLSLRIRANLEQAVLPMIRSLAPKLAPQERRQLEEIETTLGDVISPFMNNLATRFMTLTPREIEICNLIKSGLSTKEIAWRINVSELTVFKQRRNIRKKLRIADGETNLSAYLQNI